MNNEGDNTSRRASQEDYRLYLVIATMGYLGMVVHLALIPLFWWMGAASMAVLNVLSFAVWVLAWSVNRRGRHPLAITLMTTEVIIHSLAAVPLVGWDAGFQYYLMGVVPYTLFNTRLGNRGIIMLTVALWVLFSLLYAFTAGKYPPQIQHPEALAWLYYMNVFITFIGLGLSSYYFRQVSIRYESQLRRLASTDEITGLINRREMWQLLRRDAALKQRQRVMASIILMDIDHFKQINDNHGHEYGDRVLRQIASLLSSRLRQSDALARWGGEEFLALLSGTNLSDALRLAAEMRALVAAHVFDCAGQALRVTLTLGVAEHRPDERMEETIRRADLALYRGKDAGRDCVMPQTPDTQET